MCPVLAQSWPSGFTPSPFHLFGDGISLFRAADRFFPGSYITASSPPQCSDPRVPSHHYLLYFLRIPSGYILEEQCPPINHP